MNTIKKLTLFAVAVTLFSSGYPEKNEIKPLLVVLDVAHGGKDSGFTFEGINEKEIVKDIADRIVALNSNSNIKIVVNRTEDTFISLSERVSHINSLNPDAVISLHINGSTKNHENSGFEIYTLEENQKSLRLAEILRNEFYSFQTGKKITLKNAGFYLLKNIKAPAVVMEMGYLTNEKDRELILSDKGREGIAEFIINSIQKID